MINTFDHDCVCVTIWSGPPTLQDVADSLRAATALKAKIGRPIVLIGILTQKSKVPDATVRAKMLENWPKLVEIASTVQYISLPTGFTAARLISLLVEVFALTRHGKRVSVHRQLSPALFEIEEIEPALNIQALRVAIEAALKKVTAQENEGA